MSDFNSFVNDNPKRQTGRGEQPESSSQSGIDINSIISMLAGKYEGASEDEIIAAIISEAEKSRRNGTLTDRDLDNFQATLSPMLNEKQRRKLNKVIRYLKKS